MENHLCVRQFLLPVHKHEHEAVMSVTLTVQTNKDVKGVKVFMAAAIGLCVKVLSHPGGFGSVR